MCYLPEIAQQAYLFAFLLLSGRHSPKSAGRVIDTIAACSGVTLTLIIRGLDVIGHFIGHK